MSLKPKTQFNVSGQNDPSLRSHFRVSQVQIRPDVCPKEPPRVRRTAPVLVPGRKPGRNDYSSGGTPNDVKLFAEGSIP